MLSQIDNGSPESWDIPTGTQSIEKSNTFFDKYFKPYLNIGKRCADGLVYTCGKPVSGKGINYQLADGTGVSIVASASLANIVIDTNGPKKPNVIGKDAFYFEITNESGLYPYNYPDLKSASREDIINGTGELGCNATTQRSCTALIMKDGWQIKDDYPW